MKRYRCKIVGISPYMQHKMNDTKLKDWEKNRGKIHEREDIDMTEYMAALHACWLCPETKTDKNGKTVYFHFMPTDHIKQCLVEASKQHKAKVGGASRSMKSIVSGGFVVERAEVVSEDLQAKMPRPLAAYKHNEIPMPTFDVVDERSAVNTKVKARVIVKRPKWLEWGVTFDLIVSEDTITVDQIKAIFKTAGEQIGVGSYRPQHTGEFGRFILYSIDFVRQEADFVADMASEKIW